MSEYTAAQAELTRRIGFAKGQVREAMGCIADLSQDGRLYWAFKALQRALDELDGRTAGGKAAA